MRVLILGAGPAGLTTAQELRALEGRAGVQLDIMLVSGEPFPPYSPPAMADHFTTGNEASLYWQGTDVCERLGVDYRCGVQVVSVDPQTHSVALADGSQLDYDRLVIATGSRLYAPVPGYDLPGVYNFKSLTAARDLVDHAGKGEVENALIVGAGFIGVEVALMLRSLSLGVAMVEQRGWVMPNVLDQETAGLVLAELQARGVEVRLNTEVRRFVGEDHACGVETAAGDKQTADAYLAATGVKPTVDYLDGSGLEIDWGVLVDRRLRTNLPNIWAAGDVAETWDRQSGQRFVHAIWPNARAQGQVVARDMLGFAADYEGAERMNSMKHLGLPIMAVGEMEGEAELRWRRGDQLRKIFLTDGRIVGFRLAGDIRGAGAYRALMLRGTDVSDIGEDLLDPRFCLAGIAALAAAPPEAPIAA
ncbi:MAG: NAD(P)/FAD-dependent oxidoreductase [Chromatiales bacterium]|nr:MAG: NAD(P)/FAD-dependent oxidoreductase [Chromatiales bacterium]